jgi:glycosyltransferase involved in cell wall biosynthesis
MKVLDILCVGSQWGEAFPNVIGEAMSTGVICVSTDVGDSRHIIGNTGIVASFNDEDGLLNALKDAMFIPKEDRINLGKDARRRIINLYSIELMTARFIDLYSQLVNNKGRQ